jgi:hypothetical protein
MVTFPSSYRRGMMNKGKTQNVYLNRREAERLKILTDETGFSASTILRLGFDLYWKNYLKEDRDNRIAEMRAARKKSQKGLAPVPIYLV